jgi:hypothetical protein
MFTALENAEKMGGSACVDHIFLSSALVGSHWLDTRPIDFMPGERDSGTLCNMSDEYHTKETAMALISNLV